MRLKSIELQGFKSFADKIYLDFNPGITAIVGPNGSGKSNISDAIRWVMGEQSVKSLRGSKMEDVIFAGTENRKALGFAEVTLVLDNTDHYFSLDFPEIMVTRRVYRSGEGEYYINKTLCRLKDVHELFMDTGLGRDGYSIIGQGKIDSILSTKSEDRRQIFEEAAGISKYKYRKLEAERKLVQTMDNLTRVQDILGELEGQMEPLRRQSEKAKSYLLLRDELRGLDITVSVINAERIRGSLAEVDKEITVFADQIGDMKSGLAKTDQEITRMYEELKEYENSMEQCRDRERQTQQQINGMNNRVNLLSSDITHNTQNIQRLEEEIQSGSLTMEKMEEELRKAAEQLQLLQKKSADVEKKIQEFTMASQQAGMDASAKNSALEEVKTEAVQVASNIHTLHGSLTNLGVLKESFDGRRAAIQEELTKKGKDRENIEAELNKARAAVEKRETSKDKLQKERAHLEEGHIEIANAIRSLEEAKNRNVMAMNQKNSRRSMLVDMEREYEGYAKGVKGIMNAYQKGKVGQAHIHGPLAQLIRTDKEYITAIDTALGAAGQNIVTQSEEDAKVAIGYLKDQRLGRATFLPVTAIRSRSFDARQAQSSSGFIAVAADLVRCDEQYRAIISNFLGTTVICDNLDHAVSMAKKAGHQFRIVTLDGDVIQAGGAMTGGSAIKSTGSLSRTGEIESLSQELRGLRQTITQEEEKLRLHMERREMLTAQLKDNQENIQSLQNELVHAQADCQRCESLLTSMGTSASQLERELQEIDKRLEEIGGETAAKQTEILAAEEKRSQLEEKAGQMQEEYTELTGRSDKLISTLTEMNISRNALLKDMEMQNEKLSRINQDKAGWMADEGQKRGEIQRLYEQNKELEKEIESTCEQEKKLNVQLEQCRKQLETLNVERQATESHIRTKQASINEVQEKLFALTQQQAKTESKKGKLELELENIVNRMWEDYELTYSQAVELKKEENFDFKAATIRIREIRDKIRSLGNINIDAIEEYKNVKERFDFLTVQTNDLEKAKRELEAVIEEMLTIMKSRFAEQFQIINKNFNRVFSELFGGGTANLMLTDPGDILESGIEIEAQPPGKKLQSLTLLSGGERAFTAIALLFAILDVRPTPFCILDEIEAALDDANVYRYADYLRQYSSKTQFIVVTHRRGTMEAANILYGVTMQERGISKLLSLNIDEVQE